MDPITQARMTAVNTLPGSPLYELACAVCMVRMIDPNGHHMGAGMCNWQAVIMETALLSLMLPPR